MTFFTDMTDIYDNFYFGENLVLFCCKLFSKKLLKQKEIHESHPTVKVIQS